MNWKSVFFLSAIILSLFFPIVSADVISVNSGGGKEICINAGGNIENCFFCFPKTCSQLGYDCDSWSDSCGGTLNCGTCAAGFTCSSGVCTATPVPPGGGGGPSGGGPGVSVKTLTELKVIPDNFNLETSTSAVSSAKIDLSNIGNSYLDISVGLTNSLKNIISFDEEIISLGPGELKTLNFKIIAPSEAGIYTGKIIFSSKGKILQVPFVLNVRSGISLFDISLDIAEGSRIINVGEKLTGQLNLIQAGLQMPMDVSMHYIVKDFEDKVYLEESETIMVHKQKNYEHEFNTQNLPAGEYIIGAEVIYTGGVATASYPFAVIEKKITGISLIYIILLAVLIMAIVSIILIIKYYKQQKHKYRRK